MFRSPFTWIALIAIAVITGPLMCSNQRAEVEKAITHATTGTPPADPPPDGPATLVSVSPERLRLDGNRVAPQTLEVSYRIRHPESVVKAWLEIEVDEIGEIARMELPIQASGSARFEIMAGDRSLGPHVQFRAVCPHGTTAWHSMGTPPPLPSEPEPDVLQIERVFPGSIGWSASMDPSHGGGGGGKRVSLFGKQLKAECTIEAQVNGSSITLNNVRYTGKRFEGLLLYSDINYDEVAPRYAALKLVIKRTGIPLAIPRVMPFEQ